MTVPRAAIDAGLWALDGATGGGRLATTGNMVRVIIEGAEPWMVVARDRKAARWLRARATKARNAGQAEAAAALDGAADHFAALAGGEPGDET